MGSEMCIRDRSNPVQIAVIYGTPDILRLFVEDYNFSIDERQTNYGDKSVSALHIAVICDVPDCLKLLLGYGADVMKGGKCARHGDFKSAQELAKICAKPHILEILQLHEQKGRDRYPLVISAANFNYGRNHILMILREN